MPGEQCVSLVVAGLPEGQELSISSCSKGHHLCKDHEKQVPFLHQALKLFLGKKKGRTLFTAVYNNLDGATTEMAAAHLLLLNLSGYVYAGVDGLA